MCVCVCARACVRVRACVCVCVRACDVVRCDVEADSVQMHGPTGTCVQSKGKRGGRTEREAEVEAAAAAVAGGGDARGDVLQELAMSRPLRRSITD